MGIKIYQSGNRTQNDAAGCSNRIILKRSALTYSSTTFSRMN
jgi:hypothetical protein